MSWGDVWMTVGQASSRRSLIKRLISDDLGWGHKLRKWQTEETFDHMFYYCTALLVHTFLHFIWCISKMLKTIIMTFKLTWQNWRLFWHVYECCISQGSIKTPFEGDWWFWCPFVPDLSVYVFTINYFNTKRFEKVIAKIKWCSFFASQYI